VIGAGGSLLMQDRASAAPLPDGAVRLGGTGSDNNSGAAATNLTSNNAFGTVVAANSGTGAGVFGAIGTPDNAPHGAGVLGQSGLADAPGVLGFASEDGTAGVRGVGSSSAGGYGVMGSSSGVGVHGAGHIGVQASAGGTGSYGVYSAAQGIGVYGIGADAGVIGLTKGSGPGIWGANGQSVASGPGVFAESVNTSPAVQADNTGGGPGLKATGKVAVRANTSTAGGAGVIAAATNGATGISTSSDTGTALAVSGVMMLSRSGKVKVPAGATSVAVTGKKLTTSSLVLAVLQQNLGALQVRSAVPNPGASSFTVYLSAAAPAGGAMVAWTIVN
jgi:hypothetical protein